MGRNRCNLVIQSSMIIPLKSEFIPQLRQFLNHGFNANGSPWFSDSALYWKYLGSEFGSKSPKSFIDVREGKIVAHVGLTFRPLLLHGFHTHHDFIMHPIDWLASKEFPGSGIGVMLKALAESEVQCVIGGTDEAKKAHLALGYESIGTAFEIQHVMRPSYYLRTAGGITIKGLVKSSIQITRHLTQEKIKTGISIETLESSQLRHVIKNQIHNDQMKRLFEYFQVFPNDKIICLSLCAAGDCIGFALIRLKISSGMKTARLGCLYFQQGYESYELASIQSLIRWLNRQNFHSVSALISDHMYSNYARNGFTTLSRKEILLRNRSGLSMDSCNFSCNAVLGDHLLR